MNDRPNPLQPSETPNPLDVLKTPSGHTRNGKIARMRKDLRDRINQLMYDGRTYNEIIAAMGEDGQHLNEDNLSTWKSGGYTQWLRGMERREDLLFVQEAIMDRVLKKGCPDLSKAAIQMAVTKVFQLLESLPPDEMLDTMDSNNFTRLLNALAKLADGEIKCERHVVDTALKEARQEKEKGPSLDIGLSPEVRQEIEAHHFNPPA
jgi:hypothetical protein